MVRHLLEAIDMPESGLVVLLALAAALTSHSPAAPEELASANESLAYQGRIDEFAVRLLSAGDRTDASHLVEVGNYFYRLDLHRTIELHEQALKLAPDDTAVLLELAYDYTAAERCEDAVRFWDAVQANRFPIVRNAAAIASYCHVVLGNYDQAVALWARSDYLDRHVSVEKAIHNVFGRPDAAARHVKGLGDYAAHGWAGAGDWVRNAIFWQSDWWNESTNQRALESIELELKANKDTVALHELACVLEMEDLSPSKTLEKARDCGFLDGDDSTPRNSGIAYTVAVRIGNSELETLHEQWGEELLRRANNGDMAALNLLAALLEASDDHTMLAEIDELGWKKFKLANSALSRLYGLGIGKSTTLAPALSARLARATGEFPLDARLQMLELVRLRPSGIAYRDALARLIVAEFHSLSHSSGLSAQPNARGLDGFFDRLSAAQLALAEGKVSSVDEPTGG